MLILDTFNNVDFFQASSKFICYMGNKKKGETKLLIKETQRHEQLQIWGMLKKVGYTENKQNQNIMAFMKYDSLGLGASSEIVTASSAFPATAG